MGERTMKTVRRNVKGRSREHTYPVRLNQRDVEVGGMGEDGWAEGRKDRMEKEREARSDSSSQSRI